MDIVRFSGGLGNQMFQYAFLQSLKSRGRNVKASVGYYDRHQNSRFLLDEVFDDVGLEYISEDEFNVINDKWKRIKQDKNEIERFYANPSECFFWVEGVMKGPSIYQPAVFLTKNCVFVGCWQTEKYFTDIRETLISKFCFKSAGSDLKKIEDTISKGIYTSIHIRRGDYLAYENLYGEICTKEYYKKAVNYIKTREPDSKFIFFSDDMDWVKANMYEPDSIYCERKMFSGYEDWFDMYLMSKCKHNIIANSSFSWWGAWLNTNKGKIVIAPSKWQNGFDTPDIWCEGWIRL